MNGLEAMTVQEWLVTTLSTDADLATLAGGAPQLLDRIWEGEYRGADQEAPWWISFTVLEPVDVKGVGMFQIMSAVRFQVKVVHRGDDYTPALPVYSRVHQLLEARTNQPTTDGVVLTSQRVNGFQFPERDTGLEYRHVGGVYETLAQ